MVARSPDSLAEILAHVYPLECPCTEPSTLGKMRVHVARWEALTNNHPANTADRETLLKFRLAMITQGLQPATINAHMRTVTALATLAGNPLKSAGLKIPERDDPLPTPRPAEIARVWSATGITAWPGTVKINSHAPWCKCAPKLWWRALIMLAYTTGLRRADLFGLTWDNIEADRIVTKNRKTKKPQAIPIAEPLQPWLDLLRRNERDKVLGPSDRIPQLSRELKRLATAADCPSLGLQALRRACARAYEKAHAGTGRLILNHGKTMTDRHYLDTEDTLRDAQSKLYYPPELLERPTLERQRLLF